MLRLWEFTEKSDFLLFIWREGGVHEKKFGRSRGVNRLKRGAWIVCRFKRGLGKRRGHVIAVVRG